MKIEILRSSKIRKSSAWKILRFAYYGFKHYCLWKLRKYVLDRSLCFSGAQMFHVRVVLFLEVFGSTNTRASFLRIQLPEATARTTRRALEIRNMLRVASLHILNIHFVIVACLYFQIAICVFAKNLVLTKIQRWKTICLIGFEGESDFEKRCWPSLLRNPRT